MLRSWAVQDSPPGAAIAAVVARVPDDAGGLAGRGAGGRALQPAHGDRGRARRRGRRVRHRVPAARRPGAEGDRRHARCRPTTRASRSRSSSPSTRSRTRWTARSSAATTCTSSCDSALPSELLPWCEGCQSHHARRGLLVMAALNGRLCISGRAGRQPAFSRTDQLLRLGRAAARAGRAPSSCAATAARTAPPRSAHFADWAGLGQAHTRSSCGRWPTTRPRRTRARRRAPARARRPGPARPRPRGAAARRRRRARRCGRRWAGWGSCSPTASRSRSGAGARRARSSRSPSRRWRSSCRSARSRPQLERLAPHRGCTSVAVSFP